MNTYDTVLSIECYTESIKSFLIHESMSSTRLYLFLIIICINYIFVYIFKNIN